jgi:hypothetical protein
MNTHYRVSDIRSEKPRPAGQAIGLTRGYSKHSMRATVITTALENSATLDDVQRAAGHAAAIIRRSRSVFRGVLNVWMFVAAHEDSRWL